MPKPAFLVDGKLEQMFVQRTCPNTPVRLLNCNGRDVEVVAIAKRVATHARLLGGACHPLIVIIDREGREVSATQLGLELEQEVRAEGVTDALVIGVADRMIENWILADRESVASALGCAIPEITEIEGKNGKAIAKQLIPGYHETTTGVDLLVRAYASRMRNSASFAAFLGNLGSFDCWWLAR